MHIYNVAIMSVFRIEINYIKPLLSITENNWPFPIHHRTPGAQRWCTYLAMDVGEGQKQTRCIDSTVQRRSDAECSENGGVLHRNAPLPHTEPDPPPHYGWAKMVY
jgi:hypothetical protein